MHIAKPLELVKKGLFYSGSGTPIPQNKRMTRAPSIFIFTASSGAASKNLGVSIWAPVNPAIVLAYAPRASQGASADGGGHYAWGVAVGGQNLSKWSSMREGDWVLGLAHKQFLCVAQVTHTVRSVEFARAAWGSMDDGRTWELVFFLNRPRRVAVPADAVSHYLRSRYQGFTGFADAKLDLIRRRFLSVDGFINELFPEQPPGDASVGRDDVINAITDYESGAAPEFGPPVIFELIYENRPYPPKAIFALASRRTAGRLLTPGEVTSGENSPCFHVLRSLGFEIRRRKPPAVMK